jgi:hypothetical protein
MRHTAGSAPWGGQLCARIAGKRIENGFLAWGNYIKDWLID